MERLPARSRARQDHQTCSTPSWREFPGGSFTSGPEVSGGAKAVLQALGAVMPEDEVSRLLDGRRAIPLDLERA